MPKRQNEKFAKNLKNKYSGGSRISRKRGGGTDLVGGCQLPRRLRFKNLYVKQKIFHEKVLLMFYYQVLPLLL